MSRRPHIPFGAAYAEEFELSEARLHQVQEFASTLPDRFLECRELGHNWKPYTASGHPDGGFERTLRCSRCRAKRVQHLSNYGTVIANRYEHAKGYLSDIGRISGGGRGLLRLESINRMDLVEPDETEGD